MDATQEHISLAEAARLLPSKPAPSTVYRWTTTGVYGIRLPAVRCGRRIMTTRAAVEQFLAECGRKMMPGPTSTAGTEAQQQLAAELG